MNKIYTFLKKLSRNNNRDWFNAHKEEYLEIKEQADRIGEILLATVAEIEPDATSMSLRDISYRIYRDTRFSSDKTPYKTHIGFFINPPFGKKSLRYGYYFHLEPGASIIAAGNMPGPTALTNRIRRDIFDNFEEWHNIVTSKEFTQYFPTVGSDPLKTAPKGFPKDWKYIDWLKPREFGAVMNVDDDFFVNPDLAEKIRPIVVQMKRLNDFINYSVDEYNQNEL